MSPLAPVSRPSRRPGLVEAAVDGETVVYDPAADLLHRLEPSASAVWTHLDGSATLEAVAERVAGRYGAPRDIVCRDVVDLAGSLWKLGLLDGAPAPAQAGAARDAAPPVASAPEQVDVPLPHAAYVTRRRRALRHTFEVATNDLAVRDFLDEVTAAFPPGGAGTAARHELILADGGYVVRYNGATVLTASVRDVAVSALLWHINSEVIGRSDGHYPLIHAGAVVARDVAVVLPAAPESGKTTTVGGLLRAGFGYLTDEAVAIDPETLLAQPYPKALSVDSGSWEVLADLRPEHTSLVSGQWQVPPAAVRTDAVAGPAPVRFVVSPRYRAGAETRLEPMAPADTLMVLADSTFNFRDHPGRDLAVLTRLVEGADGYRLTIGDLETAVTLVSDLVGSEQLDVAE